MNDDVIVSSQNVVCLVGGAKIENVSLSADFPFVDSYIGVDGGADHLQAAGLIPVAVIGDLDSLSEHSRATFADVLCHISEQETTDFEKALVRVAAPVILAVGFTGGRLDHMLSVLNAMARHIQKAVVLVDQTDVSFVAPPGETRMTLPAGSRVSLMPLADICVTATGLRWPLHDRALSPVGTVSPSNEVSADPVSVRSDGPLLITLPRAHLQTALKAVVRAK